MLLIYSYNIHHGTIIRPFLLIIAALHLNFPIRLQTLFIYKLRFLSRFLPLFNTTSSQLPPVFLLLLLHFYYLAINRTHAETYINQPPYLLPFQNEFFPLNSPTFQNHYHNLSHCFTIHIYAPANKQQPPLAISKREPLFVYIPFTCARMHNPDYIERAEYRRSNWRGQ